jgi:hypothetical protein
VPTSESRQYEFKDYNKFCKIYLIAPIARIYNKYSRLRLAELHSVPTSESSPLSRTNPFEWFLAQLLKELLKSRDAEQSQLTSYPQQYTATTLATYFWFVFVALKL